MAEYRLYVPDELDAMVRRDIGYLGLLKQGLVNRGYPQKDFDKIVLTDENGFSDQRVAEIAGRNLEGVIRSLSELSAEITAFAEIYRKMVEERG